MSVSEWFMSLVMPWNGSVDLPWFHLAVILFGYVCLRYLFLIGPMFFWVTKAQSAIRRRVYKVNYKQGQFKTELKAAIPVLVFDAVFLASMVKMHLAKTDENHIVFSFFAAAVCFDIWFYFSHRALHTKALYPIHRLHHVAQVTNPLTAMTFSVAERFIILIGLSIGLALVSQIYPISLSGVAIYFGFNYVFTVLGHTNIEVYPPSWRPILSWFATPSHHALHHSRMLGHYGLHTRFMDRLFKTEFSDYLEVQKRAFEGQGLESLAQRCAPENILLEQVRARKIGICEMNSKTELRRRFVYQDPHVRKWLDRELRSLDKVTPSQMQNVEEWYIARHEKIFGPVTFHELCQLKEGRLLHEEDLLFSISDNVKAELQDLPADVIDAQDERVSAAVPLYLSRRSVRTQIHCVAHIAFETEQAQGIIFDLSPQSAGVQLKVYLEIGHEISLELLEESRSTPIEMRAVVINRRPHRETYRYGLKFVRLERRARAQIQNMIKPTSSTEVAAAQSS